MYSAPSELTPLHGCEKSRAVGHDHKRLDTAQHERKTFCALDLSAKHSVRSGMNTRSHVLSCIYLTFAFGIGPCVLMAEGRAEYGKSHAFGGSHDLGHLAKALDGISITGRLLCGIGLKVMNCLA